MVIGTEYDVTDDDVKEWMKIITYTLFIFIVGYVFHGYYITENMEAGLWIYIFWMFFIALYSAVKFKGKKIK